MKQRLGWTLLAWYYVRGLARADDGDRQTWLERVASLDSAAVPELIGCLRQVDPKICANAQAGLTYLMERWERASGRDADFASQLTKAFPGLSPAGQTVALELLKVLLGRNLAAAPSDAILLAAAGMVADAARVTDAVTQARALTLAALLLERAKDAEVAHACRQLAQAYLRAEAWENRNRAIYLVLRPGVDLLEAVVPLLNDPVPEVRRSAMLAVGPSRKAIHDDDLLYWLHDPDQDVQSLCEKALRSRGMRPQYLHLGRLMTDSRPGKRLQVVDLLERAAELEPSLWLRRLSHDPAPAVRAAAVRAAAEQTGAKLTDRLEQMSQNDPCATVRQLAQYYLSAQKAENAKSSRP